MNIDDINIGNYLLYENNIVEVKSIFEKSNIIYTDKSPAPFLFKDLQPVKLRGDIKLSLIISNLFDLGESYGLDIMKVLFIDDYLHTIQNEFISVFGWPLEIGFEIYYEITESLRK